MKYLYVKSVFLWLSAIAVMSLGACTSEVPGTSETAEAISFGVPQTRAAVETANDMDAFSVWGWYTDTETGGDPVSVFDETRVDQASGWNYEGGTRYWIPGKTYRFYGVYPAKTSATVEEGIIKVDGFNTENNFGVQAVDLMTAISPVMSGDDAQQVPLNFSHELCKVKFTVKAEPGIPPTTVKKVILYGYISQGNFSTGTSPRWTLDGSSYMMDVNSSPLKFEGDKSLTNTQPIEGEEWLLIPQTTESLKLDFIYTQNNTEKKTSLDLNSNGKNQWSAGKTYHYVVTVKSNAIYFAQFVIDEWRTSSTGGDIVIP